MTVIYIIKYKLAKLTLRMCIFVSFPSASSHAHNITKCRSFGCNQQLPSGSVSQPVSTVTGPWASPVM